MQIWRCSNKACRWNKTSNLAHKLSGTMHSDLMKTQAEFGANSSYRKSSKHIRRITGNRKINNHSRIRSVTNIVGNILADNQHKDDSKVSETAKALCAAVDGGYVHDANNPGHNFEAMMGKVYRPENVVRLDKHHTRISKKHCAGSGRYDHQKTMKANMVKAAKKEGIDKEKTVLTALADGAKNCWNIIDALTPLCFALICILDWFHVGKYIQRMKTSLSYLVDQLDEIKTSLWHGCVEEALSKIQTLSIGVTEANDLRIIGNFYQYIFENKAYIVDYDKRQNEKLPYTSHVAESTVEHLLNDRCKRKQKMQWSRKGLHAVIQIRVSQASGDWDTDWENIIKPKLQTAA